MLTLLRVVAIPLLVGAWFSNRWTWCFSLFVGASVTDFFDGYLARKWNCSTPFGAFLDPVADKLMVATILILIGTVPVPAGYFAGNAWILPAMACIIIAREITMSALREWGATLGPEAHSAVAVNALGKYKTSSQMASLVLLLGAKTNFMAEYAGLCTDIGMGLLFVAAFLTVQSVIGYFAGLWRFMT
jgi:CDP-diacylglycerol--glycerol-3-phosphate 3-phosphatidyltransferase